MTVDEQLERWVVGDPVHNPDRDECCPDFSCCKPELLAREDVRRRYAAATSAERRQMEMIFLGEALNLAGAGKRVHIAGDDVGEPS